MNKCRRKKKKKKKNITNNAATAWSCYPSHDYATSNTADEDECTQCSTWLFASYLGMLKRQSRKAVQPSMVQEETMHLKVSLTTVKAHILMTVNISVSRWK